jgi:hypothetical protein
MLQEVISVMKKAEPEIEFLPPRPRYQCQECGKSYAHKLVTNRRTGKEVCIHCNNKLGSNIFYCPKLRPKRDFIGKYSMSMAERRLLGSQKSQKVSSWLNTLKDKKNQQRGSGEEFEDKEKTNEEFLRGLGQK